MDFTKIVKNVPDYKEFLTVDEMDESSKKLAQEYPDIVSCFEAGKSRKGHPIYCLKIGNGSKNALMFGCPHPNEPMGAMMLEYFSRAITEDKELREELDYTWYLIKSIDVDGTKLNEKWFKGPYTLSNYARNYFRPAGYEQVEWTFPFEYKKYSFNNPIPETQILMKLIDELKPTFMYSLHNAGFGGTYWYLTKEMKEIWDRLYETTKKENVPLHLGEPEVNYIVPYAPAIFPMISQRDTYDYNEKYGSKSPEEVMSCGSSSSDYAEKYGTVTLVTELPYFYEPRIESDKLMDFTRREAALKNLEASNENAKATGELYKKIKAYISDDNPFSKMVEVSLKFNEEDYDASKKFIMENEEYAGLCKESEALDNLDIPKFHRLFMWTLLIRSCEHELEKNPEAAVRKVLEEVHKIGEENFKNLSNVAEKSLNYQVVPIRKLVRIQLESGLIVASHIRGLK
ncbi:M14 family zinc carboxypeptidase [Clostridium polynesiense]|uniref:M14 family zinc carboxypeptidase n=1 Tax=Clostridium polynesiense TaxID=1325933 RepID=UPI00058B2CAF|nr:M14 family zinc carboxypeptidase [Clostridium polynesiense]